MLVTTPVSAAVEPTDRSMPPDTMISVMLMATMPLVAIVCPMLTRLVTVRKKGAAAAKTITIITSTANKLNSNEEG